MTSTRIAGLDAVRAAAIALVVLSHVEFNFFPPGPSWVGLGYLGVEIFFALSGFLIGRIVIESLIEKRGSVRIFWVRRWMRTLPAYYAALLVMVSVTRPGLVRVIKNLIFLQNFDIPRQYGILGVSWSLAIEEWFYILLPLLVVLFHRTFRFSGKGTLLGICIVGIAICPSVRLIEAVDGSLWNDIRFEIYSRLDALLFGVLLAGIKAYWPNHYSRAKRYQGPALLLALAGLVSVELTFVYEHSDTVIGRTLSFSATSACAALLVFALDAGLSRPMRGVRRCITHVSVISYSLYLTHEEVIRLVSREGGRGLVWACVSIPAIWCVGIALYLTVERAGMKLRDAWTPGEMREANLGINASGRAVTDVQAAG